MMNKPKILMVGAGEYTTGFVNEAASARQKSFPAAKPFVNFGQYGQSGRWISDLLPHHHKIADHICVIKSMHTEAINHDPAITFFQTGHQQPGRPSLGAWASYGLGGESANLPAFVVLLDKNTDSQAQPLYARLWGSGFLPANPPTAFTSTISTPRSYISWDSTMNASPTRFQDRDYRLTDVHGQVVRDILA